MFYYFFIHFIFLFIHLMRLVYNHGLFCFVFSSFTFIEGQLLFYNFIKVVVKVLNIEINIRINIMPILIIYTLF